ASLAALAGIADAAPILFPATPKHPAEWRDERHVSPYLADWKAAAFERAQSLHAAATANQALYDVHWYDLDLTFTPATAQVSGTVRMQASVLQSPISTVDLDLIANMAVDQVKAGGVIVSFSRVADVLTVNLNRAYSPSEIVDVRVTYHGSP